MRPHALAVPTTWTVSGQSRAAAPSVCHTAGVGACASCLTPRGTAQRTRWPETEGPAGNRLSVSRRICRAPNGRWAYHSRARVLAFPGVAHWATATVVALLFGSARTCGGSCGWPHDRGPRRGQRTAFCGIEAMRGGALPDVSPHVWCETMNGRRTRSSHRRHPGADLSDAWWCAGPDAIRAARLVADRRCGEEVAGLGA